MRKLIFLTILALVFANKAEARSAFDIEWWAMPGNTQSLRLWAESMEGRVGGNIGTGKIWYVDSGVSIEGDGSSWTNAYNTLQEAVDASSADSGANRGDVIKVGQGHAEAVATAAAIDIDVAGITIEGAGYGEDQPEFSLSANLSTFQVSAADVTLVNLRFLSTKTAGGVAQGIDVTADGDGFRMIGCEMRETSVDTEFVKALNISADADECVIVGNRFIFIAEGTGGDAVAITLEGGSDQSVIAYNQFNGDWSGYVIDGTAAASLNLLVKGNVIHNFDTGAGKTMGFNTATTGDVIGNKCYGNGSSFAFVGDAMFVSPENVFMATENVETRNYETMFGAFTGDGGTDAGDSIYADMVLAQTDLDAIINAVAAISGYTGTVSAGGAGTTTTNITGYGTNYFTTDWVLICTYDAAGIAGAPEGEVRDISAYNTTTGVFTHTAFSSAAASGDKVMVARRETLTVDGVALLAAPAAGSLANYIAGTGSIGTDLGTGKSLVDAIGTDGAVLADDALSVIGVIGVPTDADNAVDSTNIAANDDGSLYERLEALLVDITAILADTGTTGVALADAYITAAKMATGSISADEIATDAIDADSIATNAITSDEIAANAIGASEIANDAIDATAIATDAIDADALAADALAEIEAEATDALEADNLDHLAAAATADTTDHVDIAEVADNSVLSHILTNDGDTSDYDRRVHSLESIANMGQAYMARVMHSSAGPSFPQVFWWVDGNASDDTGDGKTPETAKKTLEAALVLCEDTQDDWIFVRDYSGSTNEITLANAFIHIMGYGFEGMRYPRIQASTSGEAGFILGDAADHVEIAYFIIASTGTAAGIEFTGAAGSYDVWIHDCILGRTGNTVQDGIEVMSGAAAPFLVVENCRFGDGTPSAVTRDGIRFSGNAIGCIIRNNIFRSVEGIGINCAASMTSPMAYGNHFQLYANGVGDAIDAASGVSGGYFFNNTAAFGEGEITADVFRDQGTGNEWSNNSGGELEVGKTYTLSKDAVLTGTTEELFLVAGGPIEIVSFIGSCTTIFASPGDTTIQLDSVDDDFDGDFSTTVSTDTVAEGDIIWFTNVGAAGVLTIGANEYAGQSLNWFCTEGMIEQTTTAGSQSGAVTWYMTFRPLVGGVTVTVQ